ncbi:MAG: hypothetical protein V1770_00415 [bacterium]
MKKQFEQSQEGIEKAEEMAIEFDKEGVAIFPTFRALGEHLLTKIPKHMFDDGGGYSGNPSDIQRGGFAESPHCLARQWLNHQNFFHPKNALVGEYFCKDTGKIIKISSPCHDPNQPVCDLEKERRLAGKDEFSGEHGYGN